MKIKLQGGYRDGFEMEIPDGGADVIDVPRIDPTLDRAELITPDAVKRHSWDDDALTVSHDRYRATNSERDGCVVYEAV